MVGFVSEKANYLAGRFGNTLCFITNNDIYLFSSLNLQKPNGVQYDKIIPIDTIFKEGLTQTNSFVEFVLSAESTVLARNYYFPSAIKNAVGIENPKVTVGHKYHSYFNKVYSSFSNFLLF